MRGSRSAAKSGMRGHRSWMTPGRDDDVVGPDRVVARDDEVAVAAALDPVDADAEPDRERTALRVRPRGDRPSRPRSGRPGRVRETASQGARPGARGSTGAARASAAATRGRHALPRRGSRSRGPGAAGGRPSRARPGRRRRSRSRGARWLSSWHLLVSCAATVGAGAPGRFAGIRQPRPGRAWSVSTTPDAQTSRCSNAYALAAVREETPRLA